MSKYYQVVTDGKVFRVTQRTYGGDDTFVYNYDTGKPIEFSSKESADEYIHDKLSLRGWKNA